MLMLAGACTLSTGAELPTSAENSSNVAQLMANPSGRAPLTAALQIGLENVKDVNVTIDDGERRWSVPREWTDDPETGIPIAGMKPEKTHQILVQITLADGSVIEESLSHSTPGLPESLLEFPPINVIKSEPSRMEPGITFLSVRRRALGRGHWLTPAQLEFSVGWGSVVAIDHQGEVIWYFISDSRVSGIDRLQNGNILMHRANFSTLEIDLLGNIVGEFYADGRPQGPSQNPDAIAIKGQQTLHHQPKELPNGDFLAFSANAYTIEDYPTSELDPTAPRKTQNIMADTVVIFDRKGEQKWSWNTMDYLDPFRIGYDTFWSYWWTRGFDQHVDWSHGNGLSYNEEKDAVLVSLRNQCAVLSIDRTTKEINWILGRHDNWPEHLKSKLLTPIGELMWPCYQHNPRYTDKGTVIMFDNRSNGSKMPYEPRPENFSENFSRAVEFKVNEDDMTIEQIWTTGDKQDEDPCYSYAMSDAWRLPQTDNRLVIYAFCAPLDDSLTEDIMDETKRAGDDLPYGGRVVEYSGNEEVFRAEINDPNELIQWEVYGGFKSPEIYSKK